MLKEKDVLKVCDRLEEDYKNLLDWSKDALANKKGVYGMKSDIHFSAVKSIKRGKPKLDTLIYVARSMNQDNTDK